MANTRPTIIDFVEKYTRQFAHHPYLREKVGGKWTEITQEQTRERAYCIGAGLMTLGLEKGDKIALLSESRAMWILAELGALYAGAIDVPLSVNPVDFRFGQPVAEDPCHPAVLPRCPQGHRF